jgi:hypothetical protein
MKLGSPFKYLLGLASILLLSFAPVSDKPIDRIGVPGPLHFNDTTFALSWSANPRENYCIQEYLPEGETTHQFRQLLTIHLFHTTIDAKTAAELKVDELRARQRTDPVCNYMISGSPDGKEFIVDFLLSENKEDTLSLVEFNVYRYKKVDLDSTNKALMVFAYSLRSYGDDITRFMHTLDTVRVNRINQMISATLPAPTHCGR